MGLKNNYSDYGSGSSSSWMSQEDIRWSYQPRQTDERPTQKSSSYSDLAMGRCTLDDVMREFKMNGSDSPYNPDEDRIWRKQSELSGIGLSGGYMRQKSWPEPDSTPAQRLPRYERMEFATSTPVFGDVPAPFTPELPQALPQAVPQTVPQALPQAVPQTVPQCVPQSESQDYLTEEQSRVLSSLPAAVLHSLLQQLHAEKRGRMFQECRFCKNNGERESYYRSHVLKDALGRVACPVLRAFVCSRCGAHGDRAHTIKYCPLSSNEDRIKSTAMMRSVRMASGRRRYALSAAGGVDDYVLFGQVSPSAARDGSAYSQVPLDPLWAALEKKLLL